jgi:hypothetical protein
MKEKCSYFHYLLDFIGELLVRAKWIFPVLDTNACGNCLMISPRGEGSSSNECICDTTADIVVLVPVCGGSSGCGFGGGL